MLLGLLSATNLSIKLFMLKQWDPFLKYGYYPLGKDRMFKTKTGPTLQHGSAATAAVDWLFNQSNCTGYSAIQLF